MKIRDVLLITCSSVATRIILLGIMPIIQGHYLLVRLASDLGVELSDYPGTSFPLNYFDTVLKPGMRLDDVHKIVQKYVKAHHCGERAEIYYYYSCEDLRNSLRFMIFYDDQRRFSDLQGEDYDSRDIFVNGCPLGTIEE